MEKFIQNDIKKQAITNGTWFSGMNSTMPIWLVSIIFLLLAITAIVNYY